MDNNKLMPGKFIALTKAHKKFKFNFKDNGAIELNGKKVEIDIVEDDKGFAYVVFGNKKYPVDIIEKNQNKYTVLINNVGYEFSVETPISFRRKKYLQKRQGESSAKQLIAPMPGKIVEVFVEEGSEVKAGDSVVILEAMKMQNEITAEADGVVKKIHCKPEANVMKDEVLIEFEK